MALCSINLHLSLKFNSDMHGQFSSYAFFVSFSVSVLPSAPSCLRHSWSISDALPSFA